MAASPHQYYQSLVESLRLMASTASLQIASVDEDDLVTDEITMAFAMVYPYVKQLVVDGLLNGEALPSLAAIHEWVWMEVDPEVHFPESLSRHPYWEDGRRLASRSLTLMGERFQPPNPDAFLHFSIDLEELDH